MMSGETCPACGQKKRAKIGEGAAYALKSKKLNKKSIQIIAWWLSNDLLRTKAFSKRDIENGFRFVGRQALGGRMSEMLAWHIVIWIDPEKGTYMLNIENAVKVLNAGGRLDVLKQPIAA